MSLTLGGTFGIALLNLFVWLLTLLWILAQFQFIAYLFPTGIYYVGMIELVFGNFFFLYMGVWSASHRRTYDLVHAGLLSPGYWLMASLAMLKASMQLISRPTFWEKTVHGLFDTGSMDSPGVENLTPAPVAASEGVMASTAAALGQVRPQPRARTRIRARRPFPVENTVMFALATGAYIYLANYLVFHLGYMINDAYTRVDNAFDVLFSRDPHLAAIGFFWGPLPSFFDLPILAFRGVWPALATQAFAGSIEAALFSAGTVVALTPRSAGPARSASCAGCSAWRGWATR